MESTSFYNSLGSIGECSATYANAMASQMALVRSEQAQMLRQQWSAGSTLPVDNYNSYLTLDTTTSATRWTPVNYPQGYALQAQQSVADVAEKVFKETKKKVKQVLSFRDELRSEIDGWLEPSVVLN